MSAACRPVREKAELPEVQLQTLTHTSNDCEDQPENSAGRPDSPQCPLWVKSGLAVGSKTRLFYPRKRTRCRRIGTSAKGRKQTLHT
jgi:hypothetical protein